MTHSDPVELAGLLARRPEVRRVWLFGSRARGDIEWRSDIDLAVECPGADAKTWSSLEDLMDEADTLLKIDLIRLDEAPPDLARRIRAEGRILYERL